MIIRVQFGLHQLSFMIGPYQYFITGICIKICVDVEAILGSDRHIRMLDHPIDDDHIGSPMNTKQKLSTDHLMIIHLHHCFHKFCDSCEECMI